MIVALARFEALQLRRDPSLLAAVGALAVLLLLALVAHLAAQAGQQRGATAVAAAERARWLDQAPKDPHSAAHQSIYAFKPSAPLAVLDAGVEPFVGQAVWLEAHVQNDLLYRPRGDATPLERAGLRHPAGLLIALAPPAAFLLAFALVAREREQGVLRLSLGIARNPLALALSKALTLWCVLLGALLPLVVVAGLGAAQDGRWSADLGVRLVAWSAGMSVYLAVLALLGVGVCLRLRSTRLALVGLLATWLVFTLLLPRMAGSHVEASLPLRPTQALKQQLQEEAPSFWSSETARRYEREILARARAASRDDFALNYRGAELDYAERASHAVYDRVLGAFYASVMAQDAAYARWSWLSPSVAAQTLSATLAGTDFGHQLDFVATAEQYRRELVNRMNAAVMQHAPDANGKAYTADRAFWAAQPAFAYAPPPLHAHVARLVEPLFALAAWLIATLIGLYWSVRGAQA